MMHWVEPMMWGFCRIISDAMTLIGLVGLVSFAVCGLIRAHDRIVYKEEIHEDQH